MLREKKKRKEKKNRLSRFHTQRKHLSKWKTKNSFRHTITKKIHYQQTWCTKNILKHSLDKRSTLTDSNLVLNKEIKMAINSSIEDKYRRHFFLFLIALKYCWFSKAKPEATYCVFTAYVKVTCIPKQHEGWEGRSDYTAVKSSYHLTWYNTTCR